MAAVAAPLTRCLGRFRPDFLKAHAAEPGRYPFLLESASQGSPRARFDLLLADAGEPLLLEAGGRLVGAPGERSFLAALDRRFARERLDAHAAPPLPFVGGWFLYLGYELAAETEPRLHLPVAPGLVAGAFRVRACAIFDHARGETWLAGEAGSEAALEALERVLEERGPERAPEPLAPLPVEEEAPERYLGAVRSALEYIAAGDIYQANLAREWRTPLPAALTAADLYARLRHSNPGPFAGLAALPGLTVLSTSPERLVAVRDGLVQTRPIAGTRPRRGDDAAMVAELRSNEKERAEHVMLLDLERNDLGRIAQGGSVAVDEYMAIESYTHVHHIVSNVRGRLRSEVTPGGVVRAVFPGGTITGCPKVRCMEIIAELEGTPRAAYTGSFGYLGRDGSLDLNILIRTAMVRGAPGAQTLSLKAGAGIVADSDPERELEETRAKAQGLLRALVAGGR